MTKSWKPCKKSLKMPKKEDRREIKPLVSLCVRLNSLKVPITEMMETWMMVVQKKKIRPMLTTSMKMISMMNKMKIMSIL